MPYFPLFNNALNSTHRDRKSQSFCLLLVFAFPRLCARGIMKSPFQPWCVLCVPMSLLVMKSSWNGRFYPEVIKTTSVDVRWEPLSMVCDLEAPEQVYTGYSKWLFTFSNVIFPLMLRVVMCKYSWKKFDSIYLNFQGTMCSKDFDRV